MTATSASARKILDGVEELLRDLPVIEKRMFCTDIFAVGSEHDRATTPLKEITS